MKSTLLQAALGTVYNSSKNDETRPLPVGLMCFDEGMWLPPTPRLTLTISRLLN
jgi:hypothetical protein